VLPDPAGKPTAVCLPATMQATGQSLGANRGSYSMSRSAIFYMVDQVENERCSQESKEPYHEDGLSDSS
jgi:hypothetical protein